MATVNFFTPGNMNSPVDLGEAYLVEKYGVNLDGSASELLITDGNYGAWLKGVNLLWQDPNGVMSGSLNTVVFGDSIMGTPALVFDSLGGKSDWSYFDAGYDTNGDGANDIWGLQAQEAYWLDGADVIYGSWGDDTLNGYNGTDTLFGNGGSDVIAGGSGNDSMYGGDGYDYLSYNYLRSRSGPDQLTSQKVGYKITLTGSLANGTVSIQERIGTAAYSTTALEVDSVSNFEVLRGSIGNDSIVLSGSTGNQDGIQGFAGNDTIVGGDVLSGTANDGDYVSYQYLPLPYNSIVVDLTNTDITTAWASAKAYYNNPNPSIQPSGTANETDLLRKIHGIIGSSGNDFVTGSAANDWFRGLSGSDTFDGKGGNDWIDYNDIRSDLNITLAADGATQTIQVSGWFGPDTDTITNVENIAGGYGNDLLIGNNLANVLQGREGYNTLVGGNASELGCDYVDYKNAQANYGSIGVYMEWTPQYNSMTSTPDNVAYAYGHNFYDHIENIEGAKGSSYDDTFVLSQFATNIDGRGGNDTVSFTKINTAVTYNLSISGLQGSFDLANVENLIGSAYADTLTGSALDNRLEGGLGNDLLTGGAGNDTMAGGSGNDTYDIDSLGDVIQEYNGEGIDLIKSPITYSLSDTDGFNPYQDLGGNVENLTLLGSAAIDGYGNALNNTLTGNGAANLLEGFEGNDKLIGLGGADTLIGDLGNDTLSGGAGNDTMTGGDGNDKFVFDALLASNTDLITDFIVGQDKILLDDDIFTAIGQIGTTAGVLLNSMAFWSGSAAHDADDRIIYNQSSGKIYYDADGSGATAAVLFATLTGNPTLTASDFLVIA